MASTSDNPPLYTEEWFVRSFGELYPLLYRHRDDEQARRQVADLIARLELRTGSSILDVCCGDGRHLSAMRRAGLDAVGLDLSEPLLRRAAKRPELADRLVRADARAIPFKSCFDAAVNLFTSFGYFSDDRQNAGQLDQMVRCLRPDGLLFMDLPNRAAVERGIDPHSVEEVDGLRVEHHRRFIADRMEKRTTVTNGGTSRRFTESVRLYGPDEIAAMGEAAGLDRLRILGGFDGRPFDRKAERMIIIGRRVNEPLGSGRNRS